MSREIIKEQFEEAGRHFSRFQPVLTKAWKSTLDLAHYASETRTHWDSPWYKNDYPKVVDFDLVVSGIRKVESGHFHFMPVGRVAWDTIATINNDGLKVTDPSFVITWTDHIHPDFRNGDTRKQRAIERLQEAYLELGMLSLSN